MSCRVTQLLRDLFVHMHHYLDLDLELLLYSIEFLKLSIITVQQTDNEQVFPTTEHIYKNSIIFIHVVYTYKY